MSVDPTGTVTLLFTDIEGSTRLWESDAGTMSGTLVRHDALLQRVIEQHAGRVFKTVGDAFCAAFASGPDALAAALAAQREMGCHPADPAAGGPSGMHYISFYCDDIHKTVAELRFRGVEFTDEISDRGYGLVVHFRMPGDVAVELYEPRYSKA